jgi:hypothetical protein
MVMSVRGKALRKLNNPCYGEIGRELMTAFAALPLEKWLRNKEMLAWLANAPQSAVSELIVRVVCEHRAEENDWGKMLKLFRGIEREVERQPLIVTVKRDAKETSSKVGRPITPERLKAFAEVERTGSYESALPIAILNYKALRRTPHILRKEIINFRKSFRAHYLKKTGKKWVGKKYLNRNSKRALFDRG